MGDADRLAEQLVDRSLPFQLAGLVPIHDLTLDVLRFPGPFRHASHGLNQLLQVSLTMGAPPVHRAYVRDSPGRYPLSTPNNVPQVEDGPEQGNDKSRTADPDTGDLQPV